jgi:hypothetical protein
MFVSFEARRNGSFSLWEFQLYRDRTELRGPNVLSYMNIQLNFPGARIGCLLKCNRDCVPLVVHRYSLGLVVVRTHVDLLLPIGPLHQWTTAASKQIDLSGRDRSLSSTQRESHQPINSPSFSWFLGGMP